MQLQMQTLLTRTAMPTQQMQNSTTLTSAASSAAPLTQFFNATSITTNDEKIILKPITSPEDLEKLRKLADPQGANNVDAQAHLGRIYYHGGWGVATDEKEGATWLQLAAKQATMPAGLWAKGKCYENGLGVKKDINSAVTCYKKSSDDYNYAPSQHVMAWYYEHGIDKVINKDAKKALQL